MCGDFGAVFVSLLYMHIGNRSHKTNEEQEECDWQAKKQACAMKRTSKGNTPELGHFL